MCAICTCKYTQTHTLDKCPAEYITNIFLNSLFVQYPLKEVVVIHKSEETLKDVKALQNYIMEVIILNLVSYNFHPFIIDTF